MKHSNRPFIPSLSSVFSDRKKAPAGHSYSHVQSAVNYPTDWDSRMQMANKAKEDESYREQLIDSHQLTGFFLKPNRENEGVHPREILKVSRSDNQTNELDVSVSTCCSNDNSKHFYRKNITEQKPFNLSYENRPKKVEKNEVPNRFVAKKMPQFPEPFKPLLDGGNLTKPVGFCFRTDKRAEQREIYEERIRANIRAREMEIQMKRLQDEEREREEIKKIRKQMEFKAAPLPGKYNRGHETFSRVNLSALWNVNLCSVRK